MGLIKHGKAATSDAWTFLGADDPLPEGPVVVPVARWTAQQDALRGRGTACGISVQPDDDVADLAGSLEGVSLIAIVFPKFTDGRGYSSARLLRDRLGYTGEMRATGHVLPDQLFYMQRVGIDAFELADGKSVDTALAQLKTFSVTYQGAADDARPLHRRVTRPS